MVVDGQALVARKADRRGSVLAVRAGVGQCVQIDGVIVPSFMAPSLTVICIWWRELPAVMVSSRV